MNTGSVPVTGAPPRIGILYPGHAAEADYPALEAALLARGATPGLQLPVTITTIGVDEHTPEALYETGSHHRLAEGVSRLLSEHHLPSGPDLNAVMWACTSGSFVYGWEGAHEQVQKLAQVSALPTSSTSLAFVHACQVLGISDVAVAASYPEDLAEHFRRFLTDAGIRPIRFTAEGVFTAWSVSQMSQDELIGMLRAADSPGTQALLVPDTAMHSLLRITDFERALGKPVLTANQVTVWEGMRIAGVKRPQLPEVGNLFAP